MLSPRTRTRRFAVTAASVGAVLFLSGCASSPDLSAQESPGRPVPAAATPAEPVILLPEAPTVRYDVGCADLANGAALADALGPDTKAATEPESHKLSPLWYSVRHLGGFTCSWTNGQPARDADLPNPAHRSVHIEVLPDGDNKLDHYATMYPLSDAADSQYGEGSATGCFAETADCNVQVRLTGSWLSIYITGLDLGPGATDADALALASPLISSIVDPIPEPSPRVQTALVPVDCASVMPADEVLVALGVPEGAPVHKAGGEGGGYGLGEASIEYAGAASCVAGHDDDGHTRYATVQVLPGGAWVFRDDEAARSIGADSEPVSLTGTSATHSYLSCEVGASERCTVDLAIDENWVQVQLSRLDRNAPLVEQDRSEVLAFASQVLQRLTS